MVKSRKDKGFSLIEVCIALIIIATIMAPMIMLYQTRMMRLKYTDTEAKFDKITLALQQFIEDQDRMPIPASFTAGEGDPAYGAEGAVAPAFCNDSGWESAPDGMCLSPNGQVLVGAVPFQALGLTAQDALDAWKQRIIYTVAVNQVDAATYVNGGNRVIEAWALSRRLTPTQLQVLPLLSAPPDPTSQLYFDTILISPGVEGRGAFTAAGVRSQPCDPDLREGMNCEFTHRYLLALNPYEDGAARSFGNNDDYYDDLTRAYNYSPSVDWLQSEDEPEFLLGNATVIGVGTDAPDPNYRIHVEGDLQARIAVRAGGLCSNDNSDCFSPEMIAGNRPEMDCREMIPGYADTTGLPVMELGNRQVRCGSAALANGAPSVPGTRAFVMPNSFRRITCPSGQAMYGMNAAGVPLCRARTP